MGKRGNPTEQSAELTAEPAVALPGELLLEGTALAVRSWCGLPNYVCDRCGFATLDEAQARQQANNCLRCTDEQYAALAAAEGSENQ